MTVVTDRLGYGLHQPLDRGSPLDMIDLELSFQIVPYVPGRLERSDKQIDLIPSNGSRS